VLAALGGICAHSSSQLRPKQPIAHRPQSVYRRPQLLASL